MDDWGSMCGECSGDNDNDALIQKCSACPDCVPGAGAGVTKMEDSNRNNERINKEYERVLEGRRSTDIANGLNSEERRRVAMDVATRNIQFNYTFGSELLRFEILLP